MNTNIDELFLAINRLDDGDFAEAEAHFLAQVNYDQPLQPQITGWVQRDGRENLKKLHALRQLQVDIKQSKYWNAE